MSTLVLDTETHCDLSAVSEPDALTLAEAAVKRDMDVATYVATCPALARVALVGLRDVKSGRRAVVYDANLMDAPEVDASINAAAGEALLLIALHAVLAKATGLVTFNGRGFDVPLLLLRSMRYGITPAPILTACAWQKPWESRPHVDVMNLLGFGGATGRYGLASYCVGLDVPSPKSGGDGSSVADLIAARDGTGLARYSLGDVESTYRLALKAGAIAAPSQAVAA